MAKGQQRSNKETKKPKKETGPAKPMKESAPAPVVAAGKKK